jgi:hypothetical protein
MSQARKKVMSLVALYAKNHTEHDPYDIVAFYQGKSMYLPQYSRKNSPEWVKEAIEKEAREIIEEIQSKPTEYYEGTYSNVLQVQWDSSCQNGTLNAFNYFEVCEQLKS